MATAYSIPNRPSGGDPRSIAAMTSNFDAVLAALNAFDGDNIADGTIPADAFTTPLKARLGLTDATVTRSGRTNIPTLETTTSLGHTFLTTNDRVQNITVPSGGLLFVVYSALWKEATNASARAAIFLNGVQLKQQNNAGGNSPQEIGISSGTPDRFNVLFTAPRGLMSTSDPIDHTVDVTTGQAHSPLITAGLDGGVCLIRGLTAGVYEVGVKFKATLGGLVTVQNRDLQVWTVATT